MSVMLILILLAAYGRLARRLYDRIITTPTFKINRIRMDFYCRPISTGVSKHVNSYVNSKKRKDGEEYSRVPFQQTSVRYTIGKCLYRSVGTGKLTIFRTVTILQPEAWFTKMTSETSAHCHRGH